MISINHQERRKLLSLSKPVLRKKCKQLNISTTGYKSELVDRILSKQNTKKQNKEKSKPKKKPRSKRNKSNSNHTNSNNTINEIDIKDIDYESLIHSFVQQIERSMNNQIIPIEIIRLCIAYYTHLGQFYFDSTGYSQLIWKQNTHTRKIKAISNSKNEKRHCIYICYNNAPIDIHKLEEDEHIFYCTVRYESKKRKKSNLKLRKTDCWFGVVTHKIKTLIPNKKEYKKGVICEWKHNESITIELDLKRYKVWYYKSYGHELQYKRYTMMTKKIERANKYYFMLCGIAKKGDTYTLRNIGDIKAYNVSPVLFI
eukprot:356105_1